MTRGQAKKELEEAERIRLRIASHRLRLRELQDNASSLSSPQYDRVGGATPSHDALERRVICLIEQERKVEAELMEDNLRLNNALRVIEDRIITRTSGKVRIFLIKHYIEGRELFELADEFEYLDTNCIYKLHLRALDQYAAANDEVEKQFERRMNYEEHEEAGHEGVGADTRLRV